MNVCTFSLLMVYTWFSCTCLHMVHLKFTHGSCQENIRTALGKKLDCGTGKYTLGTYCLVYYQDPVANVD